MLGYPHIDAGSSAFAVGMHRKDAKKKSDDAAATFDKAYSTAAVGPEAWLQYILVIT